MTNMLKSVEEERDKLQMENIRLNHRISYLEEMCSEMDSGMKQVKMEEKMKYFQQFT